MNAMIYYLYDVSEEFVVHGAKWNEQGTDDTAVAGKQHSTIGLSCEYVFEDGRVVVYIGVETLSSTKACNMLARDMPFICWQDQERVAPHIPSVGVGYVCKAPPEKGA